MSRSSTKEQSMRVTQVAQWIFADEQLDDHFGFCGIAAELAGYMVDPDKPTRRSDQGPNPVQAHLIDFSIRIENKIPTGLAPTFESISRGAPPHWHVCYPILGTSQLNDTADLTAINLYLVLLWQAFLFRKMAQMERDGKIGPVGSNTGRGAFLLTFMDMPDFANRVEQSHFRNRDIMYNSWMLHPRWSAGLQPMSMDDFEAIMCALTMLASGFNSLCWLDYQMVADLVPFTGLTWGQFIMDGEDNEFLGIVQKLLFAMYVTKSFDISSGHRRSLKKLGFDLNMLPVPPPDADDSESESDSGTKPKAAKPKATKPKAAKLRGRPPKSGGKKKDDDDQEPPA